jgi:exonuclease SbcC
MIPLRVYVKGFMSYRDEAELSFDGSSLWMLTGRNGAGKSAIFDAITFALYGVHRLGKQGARELINHQSDNLIVEFDFSISNAIYRVKRTVQRKGRSSFQAFCLDDTGRLHSIPETDSEKGLKNWVQLTLGIEEEAFTTAVVLRQGKSDALIEAEPKEKHKVLSQIVDLSIYEKLHKKTEEIQKQHKQLADNFQKQLQHIEPVNNDQIATLDQKIAQAKKQQKEFEKRLRELSALKVQAKSWEKLSREKEKIDQVISEAQNLFAQAEQIEQEAARFSELKHVLPSIVAVFNASQDLSDCEKSIIYNEQAVQHWTQKLQQASENLNAANKRYQDLEAEQANVQQQYNDVQQKLTELAPHLSKLEEIERLRKDIQLRDQQLVQFPEDLDAKFMQQQKLVEELKTLQVALPWLEQFTDARSDWNDAYAQSIATQQEIARLTAKLQELQPQRDELESKAKAAERQVVQIRKELIRAETLLNELVDRINRFNQVAELHNCNYCGQPLTVEHLSQERTRLEEERSAAELHRKNVLQQQQQVTDQYNALDKAVKQIETSIASLKDGLNHTENQRNSAEQKQKYAEKQATQSLDKLPDSYRNHIQPDATMHITDCFVKTYPSSAELMAMEQRRSNLDEHKGELEMLDKRRRERDKQRAALEPLLARHAGLIEQYPEQKCHEIRECQHATQEIRDTAERQLKSLLESLQDAKSAVEQAEQAKNQADQEYQRAKGEVTRSEARKQEIERTIENRIIELPTLWQELVRVATHVDLETWQDEEKRLIGADTRHAQLIDARREQVNREQRLTQIVQELDTLPEEAQQSPDNLEQHEQTILQKQTEIDKQRNNAEREKNKLEYQFQRRCELEVCYKEADRKAYLYKKLVQLLGKDNLQGHLLERAEVGIVTYANEILDRISAGSLSLKLHQRSDDGKAAEAGKAFDIVAHNNETGHEPMPVALLSGGQRFRVAVSLALGIGKYASQDNQSIEAVIIDEGFGSLDKQGRREIIDQLHVLSDTLRRIILVSHQEEFAEEFPNRYTIDLTDGTSRVSLAN